MGESLARQLRNGRSIRPPPAKWKLEETIIPALDAGRRRNDMTTITVICDRCKKTVEGMHVPGSFTAGYYDTSAPLWSKYASADEKIICDNCMWNDPRYIADYGDNRNLPGQVHPPVPPRREDGGE